jgi:hypothetical protein
MSLTPATAPPATIVAEGLTRRSATWPLSVTCFVDARRHI